MKGYFVHFDVRQVIGISAKVEMQIAELEKHFDLVEVNVLQNNRTLLQKVLELCPFVTGKKYDFEYAYEQIREPDFLYVRAIWSNKQYISFFRTIKELYPKCVIIVEIPTYPYDKNVQKALAPRDRCSRKDYKKYVDVIATYSDDSEIFGVPTLNVENGIDVNAVKKAEGNLDKNVIRLIAVSTMLKNHGYERILEGLGNYYASGGQRNIVIYMVGEGPEKKYYQKIVENRGIKEHVVFCGKKTGRELDEIYDVADMALTSFGFYKIDVYRMSALKSRECLAKGLPLINGCVIDIFENEPYRYSLDFPNDASIVDMNKVISFYDEIYYGKEKADVVNEIRQFAYEKVDISVAMKPIIEFLKK